VEENVLDHEVEEETPDVEDTDTDVEENDVAEEDQDDEFEYDEEGNIVIPDVEFDPEEDELGEDTEEETPEKEPEEEGEDGESDEVTAEGQKEEETPEEATTTPDPRDTEIADLKARLNAIESQAKATLKTIGVEEEDALAGLVKVAADAENKTPEQYNAEKAKKENDEIARNMLRNQLFEAKAAADLKELHAAYPETKQYKHLREMPPEILKTFGAQRDAGFSVKQAYAAANPDGIRSDVASSVKKQAQHDSKAHLKSSVPKPSKPDAIAMSKAELADWREMFPGMSDAEIRKLYKQSQ
jgi:hypothetical protein